MSLLLDWIDDRTGYRDLARAALFEHIPGGARWRYVWGSTLVFAFVTQVVTGLFLWMSYSPSSQTAWESVYYIQHQMTGGWLLRGIHHFMAQAMIVLLALHLMQVVIDGAYRAPREFNFWIGLVLLLLTFGLGLTGYLLPWDQRGYWSTKVATNIMASVPVAGPYVQRLAVGGPEYGHHTLTRFFALHAGVLPIFFSVLTVVHVALFRRHGIRHKEPRRAADAHFWVDQVFRDAVACLAVLATVLFLCLLPKLTGHGPGGAELSAPADPSVAFSSPRPEWYFLFLFQFLKLEAFSGDREVIGAVVVPGAVMSLMFLMPIIGRRRVGHWFNVGFTVLLFTGIGLLTVMAIVQDAGRPVLRVPMLGHIGYGFGPGLLLALLAATVILALLLTTGGHLRAYLRSLFALIVVIAGVALLTIWSLTDDADRLGSQSWSFRTVLLTPKVQLILLFILLNVCGLLLTIGVLREPYAMRDVAGFSHRWQWLHRGRLGMLAVLLAGVVMLTAFNILPAAGDAVYQRAVAQARVDAERAVVLAGNPETGIPPTGAASLLREDPKTQGPRYFAQHCASCHRFDGHDGLGAVPPDPQSAMDLNGFATRQWLGGLFDPAQIDSVKYFGPKMAAHNGDMVDFVQSTVAKWEPDKKEQLQKVLAALSAEAQLRNQRQVDRDEAARIAEGLELFRSTRIGCIKCHTVAGGRTKNDGPSLVGYGSRKWLTDFIRNPAHTRFYGENNDRMPQYGVKKILTDAEIGLIADWLRGDWYEEGQPWGPPADAAASPAAPFAQEPAPTTAPGSRPTTSRVEGSEAK